MKYCYYTNLIFGILLVFFDCLLIISLFASDKTVKGGLISQLIALLFFGAMGVMIIVAAIKIKRRIRSDKQTETFLKS
jgi:hypothetical protein